MGNIKLEFDLPEFDRELSISLTIRKDGEVVYSTVTSPLPAGTLRKKDEVFTPDVTREEPIKKSSPRSVKKPKTLDILGSGNMMSGEF